MFLPRRCDQKSGALKPYMDIYLTDLLYRVVNSAEFEIMKVILTHEYILTEVFEITMFNIMRFIQIILHKRFCQNHTLTSTYPGYSRSLCLRYPSLTVHQKYFSPRSTYYSNLTLVHQYITTFMS